jgi:hypothetical protein
MASRGRRNKETNDKFSVYLILSMLSGIAILIGGSALNFTPQIVILVSFTPVTLTIGTILLITISE